MTVLKLHKSIIYHSAYCNTVQIILRNVWNRDHRNNNIIEGQTQNTCDTPSLKGFQCYTDCHNLQSVIINWKAAG